MPSPSVAHITQSVALNTLLLSRFFFSELQIGNHLLGTSTWNTSQNYVKTRYSGVFLISINGGVG